MPSTAVLACPAGCFEVRYWADVDDDVDDRQFVNDLGTPTGIARNGGDCPNCGTNVTVTWGDDDD